jgi:hypothetical protein
MDLTGVNKYGLAHDLIKVALFNILVHVAMEIQYNNSRDLFGHKFLYQLLFVEAGFALFYIFVEPKVKAYFDEKIAAAKKA